MSYSEVSLKGGLLEANGKRFTSRSLKACTSTVCIIITAIIWEKIKS